MESAHTLACAPSLRSCRAIGVCPESAVLWSNLAAAHVNLKQWGEALQAAGECLKLDPGFIKAYGRKAAAQLGLIRCGLSLCGDTGTIKNLGITWSGCRSASLLGLTRVSQE